MPTLRDFTGLRFGKLTVMERAPNCAYGVAWRCKCDCGSTKNVSMMLLRDRRTSSCGCSTLLQRSLAIRTHGCAGKFASPTEKRAYNAWTAMLRRCRDTACISYKNYGGRGIAVCVRWNEFQIFLRDMGLPPSAKHSIDRYPDNNGDYKPGNCRWATQKEQCRNTRTTVYVTIQGRRRTLRDWVDDSELTYDCIRGRMRRGLSGEALLLPS